MNRTASLPQRPSANNGVDRAQILVEIACGAAVSDVPDVTREKMTVGARHRFSLEVAFRPEKVSSKRLNDAFYANLGC
jgi:hypothetical protein